MTPPMLHENIIVGGGPAGLHMALEFKKMGIKFLLLEAKDHVGGQFDRFPRCDELISLNKRHVKWDNFEYRLRFDWHTLPAVTPEDAKKDPKLVFTTWTDAIWPKASLYAQYLQYVAKHYSLHDNIRFNSKVTKIAYDQEHNFKITLADGTSLVTRRLFLGCGAAKPVIPNVPGIEHATLYQDFDPNNLERYRCKRVMILGSGNSAFEISQKLLNVADEILINVRSEVKFARQTHNVDHVRTQDSVIVDLAQLKSLANVLRFDITKIEKDQKGRLVIDTAIPMPHWEKPCIMSRTLRYHELIIACGFEYTMKDVFTDPNLQPKIHPFKRGKYYDLTSTWESVNVPNLFLIGAAMRINDYDAASGFIHGFRCNVQALAKLVNERYYFKPLQPIFSTTMLNPKDDASYAKLCSFITQLCTESASLFELFGYFCSTLTLHANPGQPTGTYTAHVWPTMPIQYCRERWGRDPTVAARIEIVLRYGFKKYGDVPTIYFTHANDHFHYERGFYIHPVFHVFRHHQCGKDQGGMVSGPPAVISTDTQDACSGCGTLLADINDCEVAAHHCQGNLRTRWDKDDFIDPGNDDQFVNVAYNAIAAALGHPKRKYIVQVFPDAFGRVYRPIPPAVVEETLRQEPGLKVLDALRAQMKPTTLEEQFGVVPTVFPVTY